MNIKSLLESLVDKSEIVSVFCNPDDSYSSVVGFVARVDESGFILNEISTVGTYDGYIWRKLDEVFRIDHGSYYELSLHKIWFSKQSKKKKHLEIPFENDSFTDFLKFIKSNNYVLSVGINDHTNNTVTGYLDSFDIDAKTMTIHTITKEREGAFDGYTTCGFEAVFRMCCDTETDNYYKELNALFMDGVNGV